MGHVIVRTVAGFASPASEVQVVNFDVIGPIKARKTIASGLTLRERTRLRKVYGTGRWRKIKGEAKIRLTDGTIANAEVHWYEAHGVGKKEMKIKRFLRRP